MANIKQAEIRKLLNDMAESEYQEFSAKLLPGVEDILGVRLGKLRKLATRIVKEDLNSYVNQLDFQSFEERMLYGMVIGLIRPNKKDILEILELIGRFVPLIDNWSVCDSFCSSLKITRKHKDKMWEFLQAYAESEEEFQARFAAVMFLQYYIEEEWIEAVLTTYSKMKQTGYYTQMAVAWGFSMCYVKYPVLTMNYMNSPEISEFVYRKALQKIIESNQIHKETKNEIRRLLRDYSACSKDSKKISRLV